MRNEMKKHFHGKRYQRSGSPVHCIHSPHKNGAIKKPYTSESDPRSCAVTNKGPEKNDEAPTGNEQHSYDLYHIHITSKTIQPALKQVSFPGSFLNFSAHVTEKDQCDVTRWSCSQFLPRRTSCHAARGFVAKGRGAHTRQDWKSWSLWHLVDVWLLNFQH